VLKASPQVFSGILAVNILPEYIYSPFVYADIKAKTPDTPLKQQITANFRVQSRRYCDLMAAGGVQ
jgi:hypothetical protein